MIGAAARPGTPLCSAPWHPLAPRAEPVVGGTQRYRQRDPSRERAGGSRGAAADGLDACPSGLQPDERPQSLPGISVPQPRRRRHPLPGHRSMPRGQPQLPKRLETTLAADHSWEQVSRTVAGHSSGSASWPGEGAGPSVLLTTRPGVSYRSLVVGWTRSGPGRRESTGPTRPSPSG
jgi:hypothetical protein